MIICSYCTAGRPVHARGRCTACLWHAYKDAGFARYHQNPGATCSVSDCGRSVEALGLCRTHYMRVYRTMRKQEQLKAMP